MSASRWCPVCGRPFHATFETAVIRRLAEHLKKDHPSKGGSNDQRPAIAVDHT